MDTLTAAPLPAEDAERATLLKQRTQALHSRLDDRIMSLRPFESRERFGRFLGVQHLFQGAVEQFCDEARLGRVIPDIGERRRLHLIERDLSDLGLPPPTSKIAPMSRPEDVAGALGWLYVAEGSTLGAAFLVKEARKLGFDEQRGARHLAAHPDGRARHWRAFTQALNEAELGPDGDERAAAAAVAAFAYVAALVEEQFA